MKGAIGFLCYELYSDWDANPVITSIKTTTKSIEEIDFPTGNQIAYAF